MFTRKKKNDDMCHYSDATNYSNFTVMILGPTNVTTKFFPTMTVVSSHEDTVKSIIQDLRQFSGLVLKKHFMIKYIKLLEKK